MDTYTLVRHSGTQTVEAESPQSAFYEALDRSTVVAVRDPQGRTHPASTLVWPTPV